MAFDDFESSGTTPSTPMGQNDDLFDFPLVDPFGVADAPAASSTQRTSASTTTLGAAGDDLFDAADEASVLDDFEANVDRLADRVADLIEDDDLDSYLDEPLVGDDFDEPTPESAPVPPAAPKSTPVRKKSRAQAPKIVAAKQSVQKVEQAAPAIAPATETVPTASSERAVSPANSPFSRFGLLAAGLAAAFALALITVVWSAGRGMQDALASRNQVQSDTQLQARIAELEQLMNNQRQELLSALKSQNEVEPELYSSHVRVEPEWFVERKLIQEAMNEGRFREARKRLFALQAVMDDLKPEIRDELAPTVAFLIPETYRRQAEAKGGEK